MINSMNLRHRFLLLLVNSMYNLGCATWTRAGQACFMFYAAPLSTWWDARSNCQSIQGDLVNVKDADLQVCPTVSVDNASVLQPRLLCEPTAVKRTTAEQISIRNYRRPVQITAHTTFIRGFSFYFSSRPARETSLSSPVIYYRPFQGGSSVVGGAVA